MENPVPCGDAWKTTPDDTVVVALSVVPPGDADQDESSWAGHADSCHL